MATQQYSQSTLEEKLIWLGLAGTYPIYLFGSLYLVGSILGWLVFFTLALRWYVYGRPTRSRIPHMVWMWIIAMVVMLVVLWIGHANWSLGTAKTIKSTVGWAKGWALIALFIFLGACMPINHRLIARGVCVIGAHTLLFSALTILTYVARIPGELYVSPLKAIGGPGLSVFTVSLYGLNPETGAGRWQFFGPWAPAAGFLGCLFLVMSHLESDKKWRWYGIAGAAFMCLLSQSRAGLVIFVMLWPMLRLGNRLREPWILLSLGIGVPALLILGQPVLEWVMDSYQQVKEARPDSTRVRAALANIAMQRWESEAYWFGHGIVESGGKIVEEMAIGSHHSWYGLLFVKGIVGLYALAIPLVTTIIYLFWYSQSSRLAHIALCLTAVMLSYSFFENLEILSYIFWPALLIIGMALNPRKTRKF
ncbi:capsular biosynthesis protein [Alteromonas facilis]|uniref:capsular biosynthesis protein n=1 Tax=Alteromonas facilis TaxID=2048004 RepID=UPI000C290173|nr:capsular biosynthesis protein [Alteromonas facilis]